MDWIDIDSHPDPFHYDAERRSESFLFNHYILEKIHNPAGMKDYSHGIHPVGSSTQKRQVSIETARLQSIFASSIFDWVKTIFGSSLTGFFSLVITHPGLKSGATFYRPYRDFARESIFTRITAFTTTNNHSTLSVFAVKNRGLI